MRKLTRLLMVVLLLGASSAWAQDDNAINTQQEIKTLKARINDLEAKMMRSKIAETDQNSLSVSQGTGLTAGYDNGFFIKTVDDQNLFKINGMLQFRHTYGLTDDREDNLNKEGFDVGPYAGIDPSFNAFELTRPRLKLSGYVLKDIKYFIQMEFSDDNADYGRLLDFKASYSFMPEMGVHVGRYKAAFGREYNTSASKLMFADRSLANAVFNIGRSTGVELFGDCPMLDGSLHYRAGIYNGFRDINSRPFDDNDNNPAFAARVALPLLGAEPADFANESDLAFHDAPAMQVGFNFAYANALTEGHMAGGTDDDYVVLVKGDDGLSNGINLGGEVSLFGADVAYKYQGLSLMLDGYYQHADLDGGQMGPGFFAEQFGSMRSTDICGYEVDNFGFNAQAGYFLIRDEFELISRIGAVCLDNTNDAYEYAGGWNWYIGGQNLKLTMDVTYIDDLPVTSSSANFDGIQNNSLFLIRTQLQLTF
ncbi:porin [Planctomycetota bacterium]